MIAGKDQLLGWEDAINDRDHTTSARCISQSGKVLQIKVEDFLHNVQKDDRTWNMFGALGHERDDITKEQIIDAKRAQKKYSTPMNRIGPDDASIDADGTKTIKEAHKAPRMKK